MKWEYATAPVLIHATKQILDNWGQDGWELVQVVPGPEPGERRRLLQAPAALMTRNTVPESVEGRLAAAGFSIPEPHRRWPPISQRFGPATWS